MNGQWHGDGRYPQVCFRLDSGSGNFKTRLVLPQIDISDFRPLATGFSSEA
jgi:hypothetical protein